MKKLLYIGHEYHNKTKSTQFLQEMFKTKYEVEVFDYDPYNDTDEKFAQLKGKQYDVLVVFQIMPSLKWLKKYVDYTHAVFFPMYDGVPSREGEIWYDYRNFNIINFSCTLHEELLKMGMSSYYIQYFPEPKEVENWGNEKSIFFWQRVNHINIKTIEKLFDVDDVEHLHLHKAIDPCHTITNPSVMWKEKVSTSVWYDKKEDMLKDIENSAIYIAPRVAEGIGMSFLEAMSMGRCVVSPNNPTMNEYIEHNKTGILYDYLKPEKLGGNNIRQIQEQTLEYIRNGYQKWQSEKLQILEWVEAKPVVNQKKLKKYFSEKHQLWTKRQLGTSVKFGIIKKISKIDSCRIKICGIEIFKKKWKI